MQMIRQDNYIGLRYNINSHADNFEIFDITKDLQQGNNLAGNPGMDIVQQLMKDKVLQSRRPNSSAARPYDNELVPAVSGLKTISGISWKSFKGDFKWVPDVTALEATETGNTKQPDTDVKDDSTQALLFTGYLQIPVDGDYTFYMNASGKAFLRLHDAALIDEDYGYEFGVEKQATIKLKKGLHPFRLTFLQQSEVKAKLKLQWSGPEIAKQPIPESIFVHAAN